MVFRAYNTTSCSSGKIDGYRLKKEDEINLLSGKYVWQATHQTSDKVAIIHNVSSSSRKTKEFLPYIVYVYISFKHYFFARKQIMVIKPMFNFVYCAIY